MYALKGEEGVDCHFSFRWFRLSCGSRTETARIGIPSALALIRRVKTVGVSTGNLAEGTVGKPGLCFEFNVGWG